MAHFSREMPLLLLGCLAGSAWASWMRVPTATPALHQPLSLAVLDERTDDTSEAPGTSERPESVPGRVLNRTFRIVKGAIHGNFVTTCSRTVKRVSGDKTLEPDTYLDLSFDDKGYLTIRYYDEVGNAAGTVRYDYGRQSDVPCITVPPFHLEGTGSEAIALRMLKEKYGADGHKALHATQVVDFPDGLNALVKPERSDPTKIKSLIVGGTRIRVRLAVAAEENVCQAEWSMALTATLE